MKIASLIKELRKSKVLIKLVDNKLEVTLLEDAIDPKLLEKLKAHKQEVINYLSSISANNTYKEIPKVEKSDSYPVSNAQLRMWLESQSENASLAYNVPFEMYLTGTYDAVILEKAIQSVISRHEILRTVFRLNADKELRQYITPSEEVHFKIDYQNFTSHSNGKDQAEEYVKSQMNIPFDLEKDSLIKVCLLQYKADAYIFFCNLHHIVCDAWSIPILKQEILTAYTNLSAGKNLGLPDLRIQYKDYVSWHKNNLESELLAEQKKYWLSQFTEEIPVLEFPLKNTRPPVKTYNGQTLKTYLGKELRGTIRAYQKQKEGSLYMVMLSTLYVMLSRYTGANEFIIGSPFAAREHADLKNQIGFYTNTLALKNQLEKADTFDGFYSKVKQSVLEAHRHQQYPFDELVKDLKLKKDLSRNPIFDVMLVVLPGDTTLKETVTEQDDHTIVLEKNSTSKFDLLFFIEEIGDDLSLKVEYNTDLYEESLIRQFINHYKKMLALLLLEPQKEIATINYLSEDGLRNADIDHTKYQLETVISLFENQVAKTPDAIAVHYLDTVLTYQQLNESVNSIAAFLKQQHQQITKTNVGVLLDRSHFNVVAMLGVIKSGACYVPIDAKYREDRQKYIIADAEITTIISTTDVCETSLIGAAKVTHLDTFSFADWDTKNPAVVNSLDDAAFIIYTSGSTGNPKGVIQTHRMLSNLIQWNTYDADITMGLKHLQYTSFSFDVSLQDCWFVLSSGGTMYITPESMKIDFLKLADYILENGIEVLCFPFSAMSSFFEFVDETFYKKHQVKHVISSGEQLTINQALEIFLLNSPEVKLHNHYGPAETHVVTSYTLSAENNTLLKYVPIGKPVANTTIYFLDNNLRPVPEKVIGEIYIGGANLAKGYVKLPQLTEARFIANPFRKEERLYKTGDLGYVDANGVIIYLGRNDKQIKIRGYRIELAEIKNALLSLNGIHQAHADVVTRKKEKAIAAYLVSHEPLDKRALKKQLSTQLPEYMVPAYIIQVDHIPLTSNGKINTEELPEITEEALVKATYLTPQTATEKKLVAIWEKILEVSNIGISDNFFELGGHSLYITRMLYEINETFDINLQMKNVFVAQNIQELAQLIEEERIFNKGIIVNQKAQKGKDKNIEIWEI